jgi:hypothetical protein
MIELQEFISELQSEKSKAHLEWLKFDLKGERDNGSYYDGQYAAFDLMLQKAELLLRVQQPQKKQDNFLSLREELEQKLSNAYAARDFACIAQSEGKHMKASERIKVLTEIIQLLDKLQQPVA